MAKKLQLKRGTTSQHSSFTGAVGEVTIDTDKKVVVVHDGSTAGGVPLAKGADVVAVIDEDDMATDSATRPPSQQSVKAYAQPLDADLTSLASCQTGAAAALAALTSTEVAILDDAVVTTTELNYLDNVTSNVQTQLDAKQAADADTAKTDIDQEFTKPQRGDITVATHSSGSNYDFDLDVTNNFKLTISAAVELGFSNLDATREGQTGTIYIDNGTITPTWGAEVQFEGGTDGTISITQSAKSVLAYYVIPGGSKVLVTGILDVKDD